MEMDKCLYKWYYNHHLNQKGINKDIEVCTIELNNNVYPYFLHNLSLYAVL